MVEQEGAVALTTAGHPLGFGHPVTNKYYLELKILSIKIKKEHNKCPNSGLGSISHF